MSDPQYIWRRSHFCLTCFAHTRALIWTLRAPYKHTEALRREITATTTCALRVWRVVAQTERAQQLHDFLMTELLGTDSLFRAVNCRLSDWSVVHSELNLSSDWLIVRTRWSKPIKTYWQRLIAFTHFSRIGILTQLDSGQPAFQALHLSLWLDEFSSDQRVVNVVCG